MDRGYSGGRGIGEHFATGQRIHSDVPRVPAVGAARKLSIRGGSALVRGDRVRGRCRPRRSYWPGTVELYDYDKEPRIV